MSAIAEVATHVIDDRLAKRNALVLAVTQALAGVNVGVLGGAQSLRVAPQLAWPPPETPLVDRPQAVRIRPILVVRDDGRDDQLVFGIPCCVHKRVIKDVITR